MPRHVTMRPTSIDSSLHPFPAALPTHGVGPRTPSRSPACFPWHGKGRSAGLLRLALSLALALRAWAVLGAGLYENMTFVTFAGPSEAGMGWRDGVGAEAQFNAPDDVAVGPDGTVFVADTGNNTVRAMDGQGRTFTLAGLAGAYGTNDGFGASARFNLPQSLKVDRAGFVYLADTRNSTIRRITPRGDVITWAGVAQKTGTNDGPGVLARFNGPAGIAIDAADNLYVADTANHIVRQITPEGNVITIAGVPQVSGTNDGPRATATFNRPEGIAVGQNGAIFVADTGNHTIRRILLSSGEVTTIGGVPGVLGFTDGARALARLYGPRRLIVDSQGGLLITENRGSVRRIRRVSMDGTVTGFAGANSNAASADGPVSTARFSGPSGMAFDSHQNLFLADCYNNTVRRITAGLVVSTPAGRAIEYGKVDGVRGAARFNNPYGLAIDGAGNIYVGDNSNSAIRKITPDGLVTTFVSVPQPAGLTTVAAGDLYVAESGNHTVSRVSQLGVRTVIAGTAGVSGTNNGPALTATFSNPAGIAVDAHANVYVSEEGNHTIRMISSTGVVSTLAGVFGVSGGKDGPGGQATFSSPRELAFDSAGNLLVMDWFRNRIRKVTMGGVVSTLAYASDAPADPGLGRAVGLVPMGFNGRVFLVASDDTAFPVAGNNGYLGYADGTGSDALFRFLTGTAVGRDGTVYAADSYNNCIHKSVPTAPDRPVMAARQAVIGTPLQLGIDSPTATNITWTMVRRPYGSKAELSDPTAAEPVLIPDVPDLYILRLRTSNALGQTSVRTLRIQPVLVPSLAKPTLLPGGIFEVHLVSSPGSVLELSASEVMPATTWSVLTVLTNDAPGDSALQFPVTGSSRFFRIRLKPPAP